MINAEFQRDSFSEIPSYWKCPYCKMGYLSGDTKSFLKEETKSSKNDRKRILNPRPYYRFSGILRCNRCEEVVVVSGNCVDIEYEGYDEERDQDYYVDYIDYEPKFFHPAIHLFDIPKKTPISVQKIIIQAFGLYWNDLSSCANKIRIAIEGLLTELGVKRTYINRDRKRKDYPLEQRIGFLKKNNPRYEGVANQLLAIKWIGNEGSHFGEDFNRTDLFTSFELLDHALELIYLENAQRLNRVAKEVIKRKGIQPKRKLSFKGRLKRN